jgi:hypothetical protein
MLPQRRFLLAALSAIALLSISHVARATSVETGRDSVHQNDVGDNDLRFGDGANGDGTSGRDDLGVALGTLNIGEDDPSETTSERDVDGDHAPKDSEDKSTDVDDSSGRHDVGDDEGEDDGEHHGDHDGDKGGDPDSPVPEPSTALLVAFGLGSLVVAGRRR